MLKHIIFISIYNTVGQIASISFFEHAIACFVWHKAFAFRTSTKAFVKLLRKKCQLRLPSAIGTRFEVIL